jgi:hypothetical protein
VPSLLLKTIKDLKMTDHATSLFLKATSSFAKELQVSRETLEMATHFSTPLDIFKIWFRLYPSLFLLEQGQHWWAPTIFETFKGQIRSRNWG